MVRSEGPHSPAPHRKAVCDRNNALEGAGVMAMSTSRLPRYRRAASPPAMLLTDRDQDLIRWVAELRFATQEQLQGLLFSPKATSSCKRRLTLLYHNAYLDRRLIPLHSS